MTEPTLSDHKGQLRPQPVARLLEYRDWPMPQGTRHLLAAMATPGWRLPPGWSNTRLEVVIAYRGTALEPHQQKRVASLLMDLLLPQLVLKPDGLKMDDYNQLRIYLPQMLVVALSQPSNEAALQLSFSNFTFSTGFPSFKAEEAMPSAFADMVKKLHNAFAPPTDTQLEWFHST